MLINANTQTKYALICLQIKDPIVTDKKIVWNKFNKRFNSVTSKIDSKIIQAKTNFQGTLKHPNYKTTKQGIKYESSS